MKLAGLTAVITGASQGLGAVIAYRFVADGASVVLTARSSESLEVVRQSLLPMCVPGQIVLSVPCDVSQTDDVDNLMKIVRSVRPGLDILVNNASIFGPMGGLEELPWQGWIDTLNVNLMGTVYTCRAAIPFLKNSSRGKIINISGGGAARALPSLSAYAVSKAAVLRFTEELSEEMRPFDIDVNAVAPGPLNTRFVDQALAAGPERLGQTLYNEILEIRRTGGTPFNLGANLCAYLASRESDGVTGKLISARYDNWATLHERIPELNTSDIYTMRRIDPYTVKKNRDAEEPIVSTPSTADDINTGAVLLVDRHRARYWAAANRRRG